MADIFKEICEAITKGAEPNVLVTILAGELKEQRGEIAKLRLLLEHEETVRSKKLHRVVPAKQNSFLRDSVMKVGDRVVADLHLEGAARMVTEEGTVRQVDKNRFKVEFDNGQFLWKKSTEVRRVKKTA